MKNITITLLLYFWLYNIQAQSPYVGIGPTLENGFVCFGNNARITASAVDTDTHELQFQEPNGSWSSYAGASGTGTEIIYNLSNFQKSGAYRIQVSNGGVVNYSATIYITAQRPNITIQPINQTQCYKEDVYFYIDDFGPSYSYQWEKSENGTAFSNVSGSKYSGITTNALKLNNITTADNDHFRCIVSDAQGCLNTSNSGSIEVNYLSTIKPTTGNEFCEGDEEDFYPTAITGNPTLFEWQYTENGIIKAVTEGPDFINTNSDRLTIKNIPEMLTDLGLTVSFSQELMSASGALVSATCPLFKERTGYIVNAKPVGPTTILPDSTCGEDAATLIISDAFNPSGWRWYNTIGGTDLGSGLTFTTPTLSESTTFYMQTTDLNGCKSDFDSVLAVFNPLPSIVTDTIIAICPENGSFNIPYHNLENGADLYSLSLSSGNTISGFTSVIDANITPEEFIISLPLSVPTGTYSFDLIVTNSLTSCSSDVIKVSLYVKKPTDISTSPISQTACEGTSVSFSVSASGEGPLTYQWYLNNNPISGATSALLDIPTASITNQGNYHCVVSGECGNLSSSVALLTINPSTKITIQPTAVQVCENDSAIFSVSATGTGVLSYQWKKENINIGSNSSTLTLANLSTADNNSNITCIVTSDCGEVTSVPIALGVWALPLPPTVLDTGFCQGVGVNPLVVTPLPNHIIKWYSSNNTTASPISPPSPNTNIVGITSYYISQTDGNSCESPRAEMSVEISPEVTAVMTNSSSAVCAFGEINNTIDFTISASGGNGTFSYQWAKEETEIPNQVTPQYTGIGAGNYSVTTTSGFCKTNSTVYISSLLSSSKPPPSVSIPGSAFCSGSSVTLVANQQNGGDSYRWYNAPNETNPIATNANLIITDIQNTTTYYAATALSENGITCESDRIPVTINVIPSPSFTLEPLDQINCAGNTVTFESAADLSSVYQWQKKLPDLDWENIIDDATDSDLRVSRVGNSDNPNGTLYRAIATANSCSIISSVVELSVNDFTDNLADITACEGDLVTFSPPSTTGNIAAYQWQKRIGTTGSWNIVQDGTNPDYIISSTDSTDDKTYFRIRLTFYKGGAATCVETSDQGKLSVTIIDETTLQGSATICDGESSTLKASGCNGTLNWSDDQEGEEIQVNPSSTTIYTAVCKIDECDKPATNSITITVNPGISAPTITANKTEICFGDSVTLNASDCPGTLLWSNGESGSEISVKPISETTYSATCSTAECTSQNSNELIITGYPELNPGSISTSNIVNCAGFNPPNISSETEPNGGKSVLNFSWEKAENCTAETPTWAVIAGANSISYNPTTIQVSTCYRRKVLDQCGQTFYSNISTVLINPDPEISLSSSKSLICSNESFELTASIIGGAGDCSIIWQKNLRSSAKSSSYWENIPGTNLTNTISNISNSELDTVSVYFRAIYDCDLSNCNIAKSEATTLQVLPSVDVELNFSDSTACIGNTVDIVASNCGGTILWSDGTSGLVKTVEITESNSYTVSCSSSCGTYSAIASISAIPGLAPPINTTPVSAILPNALTFSASGTDLRWYDIDGVLPSAPIETEIGNYQYWVSQSNSTCESPKLKINSHVYSPLRILEQSSDGYNCKGNTVKFTVKVIGAGDIHYQWQRKRPEETTFMSITEDDDGVKLPYYPTLKISAIGDDDNPHGSEYRCLISDSLSYVVSNSSKLYANIIYGKLPNIDACIGQDVEIDLENHITLEGEVDYYQWQVRDDVAKEWIDLEPTGQLTGVKTTILKFKNVQVYHGRKYRCRIYFKTGGIECIENTDQTRLSVGLYPDQPSDKTVEYCEGKTTKSLSFIAKPNDDYWYLSEYDEDLGSTKPFKPSSDSAGVFTYWFSSVTDEGCASPKAKYTVNIIATPEAPENTTPEITPENSLLVFSAKGENLKWYKTEKTRTFQYNAPEYREIDEYQYYVTQSTEQGCESPRTHIEAIIQGDLGFISEMTNEVDCDGNGVRFYANGKGIAPLSYRWEKQRPEDTTFTTIPNQNGPNLSITNVGSSNNPHLTAYRVSVKDATGDSTLSNHAYLLVNEIEEKITDQQLCLGSSWKIDVSMIKIRGNVHEYQLQRKDSIGWVIMDTLARPKIIIDSTYWFKRNGNDSLEFIPFRNHRLVSSIDSSDKKYRLRVIFEGENYGSCARYTNEFEAIINTPPLPPNDTSYVVCQNQNIISLDSSQSKYLWFESLGDSSAVKNFISTPKDSAGSFSFWYAKRDSLTGCISEKDTFSLNVLPTKEISIIDSIFTFCTGDSTAAIGLDEILDLNWYLDDSLTSQLDEEPLVKTDSINIQTYWVTETGNNGCISPTKEILVKVGACEEAIVNNIKYSLSSTENTETECKTFPNPFKINDLVYLYTENIDTRQRALFDSEGKSITLSLGLKHNGLQKMNFNTGIAPGNYTLKITDQSGNHCYWKMVKH